MNDSPARPWLSQIEAAHSAADLTRVVREYLGSLTPDQLAALPVACRANAIGAPSDIQEWAVTLARDDLTLGGSATLHEAAVIFAAAGSKLAKVAG